MSNIDEKRGKNNGDQGSYGRHPKVFLVFFALLQIINVTKI